MRHHSSRRPARAAATLLFACVAGLSGTTAIAQASGSTPRYGAPQDLPGRIEAEDFDLGGNGIAYRDLTPGNNGGMYRNDADVDIVPTGDSAGGGYDVNYFETGEWLAYTINATETARYAFELRVSSAFEGSAFRVEVDGQTLGRVVVPNTGAWDAFTWVAAPDVVLQAGTHTVRLVSDSQYFNLNALRATTIATASPYHGTPHAVPGVIEAEDFDAGGEGIAYHDKAAGNAGGRYRPGEDVDIVASADADGGDYDVNNIQTGEWLSYTIDVSEGGPYDVNLRVASAFPASAFRIEIDGQDRGLVTVPDTGAWDSYEWTGLPGVQLAAGTHVLRIVADAEYFNLNRIALVAPAAPVSQPYGGSPVPVPGYIEAANFDLGGEGVTFHDLTAGNLGGQHRPDEDVDIVASSGGEASAFDVNFFETGEWLNYTIDVPADGDYDIRLATSSAFSDSAWRVSIDGEDVSGRVSAPNTGDWSRYEWSGVERVALTAGRHVLTVYADTQYFNLNAIRVLDSGTPPPDSGAKLLFRSGFEGTSAIVPASDCWGTGCWQDIVGFDDIANFDWPSTLWGGTSRFLLLTDPVWMTPATLGDYMFNRIENADGPRGNRSNVLYQQITRNVNGTEPMGTSPAQNELQFLPANEPGDLYVSFWIKLQPDLVEKMTNLPGGPGIGGGGTWRAFFALKTGSRRADGMPLNDGDYRIETYIMTYGTTQPYWAVLGDNNAGGGAPLVNNWSVENRNVPVKVGEWFKFEIFWHRSAGNDGRVWMAIDGEVIADRRGPNTGAWNLPINRIMAPMLYSGSRMPIYQWIDDIEIWDGFPPAGANPPYAPH